MTHYYCIVYLVLTSVVFGLYLIIRKDWKNLFFFVCAMTASAGISIMIFPAMISHIFSGYRGIESIDNFINLATDEYSSRIMTYMRWINQQLFGWFLKYILLFLIIMVFTKVYKWCIASKSHKENFAKIRKKRIDFIAGWCILLVPEAVYFFIVSKSAVFLMDRYMFPIYAVILETVILLMYFLSKDVAKHKSVRGIVLLMCVAMLVRSWKTAGWQYLYRESADRRANTVEYNDSNAVIIYDDIVASPPPRVSGSV